MITALVARLIPSDEAGPGALDAGVVEKLDELVASSRERRPVYRSGLAVVDRLARRRFRNRFERLQVDQQVTLLASIDQAARAMKRRRGGWIGRQIGRLLFLASGEKSALKFFRIIVNDVMALFYSSEIAWAWLGYDGPPFQSLGSARSSEE